MNDYFDIWKLFAGLGLFLFGMKLLESALKMLAGKGFRRFLRNSTDKPMRSVFAGVTATTLVQSSSLVGLIVLAFVGAEIIPLVNAIGIIIGSNLGTTFTGWIVTTLGFKLNFSAFIYPLIALGGLGYGLFKGKVKNLSLLLLGFALLLMGLDFMKDSVSTLTDQVDLESIRNYPLIVYLIAGAIFTAIIQSSSATMMLTLSALYAGILPLPSAAALVIGADLGTTSTVFLGSLQGSIAKRRLAMAHVIFNFTVDAVAFILLYPLLYLISWLQLTDPLYALVAFHSLFNLFGLLLFLPFIRQFAQKLEKWFPDDEQGVCHFIHNVSEDISDAAIEALSREVQNLLFLVVHLNLRFLGADSKTISNLEKKFRLPNSIQSVSNLEEYMAVKGLEGEIINYALKIKISNNNQSKNQIESQAHQVDSLINAARLSVDSAKAFKDIEQDLASFHIIDNEKFSLYFDELKATAVENNLKLIASLDSSNHDDGVAAKISVLEKKIEKEHKNNSNDIYSKEPQIGLSPVELSTLLNVNNEIRTSANALLKSIKLVCF